MLRTEGLDVNMDCGGGNRPLHYALQDSLTPLTEGAYWGIAIFMYVNRPGSVLPPHPHLGRVDLGARKRRGAFRR